MYIIYYYLYTAFDSVVEYGTISPKSKGYYTQQNVYITCHSRTPPSWYKNGKALPKKVSLNQMSIQIKNSKIRDSGNYTCLGTYDGIKEFSASSIIYVGSKSLFN